MNYNKLTSFECKLLQLLYTIISVCIDTVPRLVFVNGRVSDCTAVCLSLWGRLQSVRIQLSIVDSLYTKTQHSCSCNRRLQ